MQGYDSREINGNGRTQRHDYEVEDNVERKEDSMIDKDSVYSSTHSRDAQTKLDMDDEEEIHGKDQWKAHLLLADRKHLQFDLGMTLT